MSKTPSARPRPRPRFRWGAAVLVAAVAASLGAAVPSASAVSAGDEPGVTMRAFQLGQPISELCTLRVGHQRVSVRLTR